MVSLVNKDINSIGLGHEENIIPRYELNGNNRWLLSYRVKNILYSGIGSDVGSVV